jgi:glutathione peroxidase-family protein
VPGGNGSFVMMEKIDVNGPKTHPVYAHLKQASGDASDVDWCVEGRGCGGWWQTAHTRDAADQFQKHSLVLFTDTFQNPPRPLFKKKRNFRGKFIISKDGAKVVRSAENPSALEPLVKELLAA